MGRFRLKFYALGLVVVLALAVMITAISFSGGFTDSSTVTVVAPRSGLLMNPGAKVTFRGLQVGRVAAVESHDDGADIVLAVDANELDEIPDNARVDISSSTVFGAKYVNFIAPQQQSYSALRPGATINTDDVMVEINTVFQNLTGVLRQVEPEKLNEVLGALSGALGNGGGASLGTTIDEVTALLARLNSPRTRLGPTLDAAADAIMAYAPSAPELESLVSHVRSTASTITDKNPQIDLMLAGVMGFTRTGTDFLKSNGDKTIEALRVLNPTTDLLRVYAPAFTCTIIGMDHVLQTGLPALGSKEYPGIHLDIGFLPGVRLYGYPDNLPVVGASGGPRCFGLPDVPMGTNAPYLVTNTGVNPYRDEPKSQTVHPENLLTSLLGQTDGGQR